MAKTKLATGALLQSTKMPSSLQSRAGWARYFDVKRPREPHLHQIEPTNHCPCSCVMCPRKKMSRETGFMEMPLFEKVMDEVAHFDEPVRSMEIELFHFGESLLHPEIHRMVACGQAHDLKVVLSVNAPQLTPDVADRILAHQPHKLIVSLDGYDQQSYQQIRGSSADYATAEANLEHLIERHGPEQTKSQIVVQMIKLASNADKAEEFKARWEDKGLQVNLRDFFPWGEKELIQLGVFEKYPPGMPCPFPWQYLVVQWNGDVVPCCRDYNGVNSMGNVKEKTLTQIWNSDRYEAFRHQHRLGEYGTNTTCAQCMALYYTEP